MSAEISNCTQQDYDQIVDDLREFWDGRNMHHVHHPMFLHEFGNSAFVIRDGGKVVAYLFGFVSQTEPVGYVHLVAVRAAARRRGLGQKLVQSLRRIRATTWLQARQSHNDPVECELDCVSPEPRNAAAGRIEQQGNSGDPGLCRPRRAARRVLEIHMNGPRRHR